MIVVFFFFSAASLSACGRREDRPRARAWPWPPDRRHHAPLPGLVVVQAVEQALGVGVRGQDVELADRQVARLLPRHRQSPESASASILLVADSGSFPPDAVVGRDPGRVPPPYARSRPHLGGSARNPPIWVLATLSFGPMPQIAPDGCKRVTIRLWRRLIVCHTGCRAAKLLVAGELRNPSLRDGR